MKSMLLLLLIALSIGLTSLHIIKAENSDMNAAYWGNEAWGAGIVIDSGEERDTSLS